LLVSIAIFKFFLLFQVLKKLIKSLTSLCICSNLYAYTEHTGQELMHAMSIRLRTDVYTEHTPQKLMRTLSTHMKFEKVPLKHAEHTCQELMHTLSINVGN